MELKRLGRMELSERLAEIHRAVARSPRFDAVLQLIVAHAAELVEADLALLLLSDGEGLLRVRAARGAGKTAVWEITVPREDALGDRLREILGLAAEDALLSSPIVVDPSIHGMLLAILRSPRRIYVMGMKSGQTDAVFFDSTGRRILSLDIRVDQDSKAVAETIGRVLPTSRIQVQAVNNSLILTGTTANAADSDAAMRIAASLSVGS